MKKTVATFCLLAATLGLSACSSATGDTKGSPYYATGRTASYGDEAASADTSVAPAEKVFKRAQTK